MNKTLKLNIRDMLVLRETSLMAPLGPSAKAKMMELVVVNHHEARDILFSAGDPGRYIYCVLHGYVRLFRLNREGREADIRIFGQGDTINDWLLVTGGPCQCTAQAAEPVTVARFEIDMVRALAVQEPDMAMALIEGLASGLETMMEMVASDRLQTAHQRVANYLLQRCPQHSNSAMIRLPYQKSLLAGQLGLAPEALSRAFSALRCAGVIVRGRHIQVNDVDALRRI